MASRQDEKKRARRDRDRGLPDVRALRRIKPLCVSGGGGCEKVQTSDFAKLAGIPVAVLGLAGYALILASLWVRGEAGAVAGALLALAVLTVVRLLRLDDAETEAT
jgi:uncharacterized membrane protein